MHHPFTLTLLALSSLISGLAGAEVSTCDGTPSCVVDLRSILSAGDAPSSEAAPAFLAQAGAEAARRMDAAHDAAIEARGYGEYYGNRLSPNEEYPEAIPQDCTTFVLEVLSQAFIAAGQQAEWEAIFAEAVARGKASSDGLFKGLDLMRALQEMGGWEGSYWNPDVKDPSDADDEHPYSAYLASRGSYYGLDVNPENAILDYRPSDGSETTENDAIMETLKSLPFAVLAARGGRHMSLLIDGQVYEVHWADSPTSKNVIEYSPLEDWAWLSGAILYPPGTWPDGE